MPCGTISAASTFLEGLGRIDPRGPPRRRKSEDNACQSRDAECEQRDTPIQRDVIDARDVGWSENHECTNSPGCKQQSKDSASGCQDQALGQELLEQTEASGTEGRTHRDFAGAGRATG